MKIGLGDLRLAHWGHLGKLPLCLRPPGMWEWKTWRSKVLGGMEIETQVRGWGELGNSCPSQGGSYDPVLGGCHQMSQLGWIWLLTLPLTV